MASVPQQELKALRVYVRELERHFLERHLAGAGLGPPTRGELLDVAAFVVLTHGAIENFVEGLALWAINRVEAQWTASRRTSRAMASVLLHHEIPPELDHNVPVFDQIRDALATGKTSLSRAILLNHGIAPTHLRALFYPLGVNVPSDPLLTASLELIVVMRHEWAHQYRYGAKVVKSAVDVRDVARDCMLFARRLAAEASAARP